MRLNFLFDFRKKLERLRKKTFIFTMVVAILNLQCGQNIFVEMSIKDSDPAVFEDALKLIDQQEYDRAIAKILSLSSSYQNTTTVKEALAGAYAGKCGLNFISFLTALSATTTVTLFSRLMQSFQTVSPSLASCLAAETLMKSFGTATQRTNDQNFFLAIYGLAKMGLYFRNYADTDADKTVDGTFDPCSAASISDADVKEVFTGLGLVIENFTALSASITGGAAGAAINGISAACTVLGITCNITDTSLVTAGMANNMRDLMATSDTNPTIAVGLYNCVNAAVAPCCP